MDRIIHRPLAAAAAAVVGVGIITATPAGTPQVPTLRTDAVAPASLVDDLLSGIGTLTNAVVEAVTLPVYAAVDVPFFAGELLINAVQNPSLIPSLASFGVQRYLNPTQAPSWPFLFNFNVINPLLGLLPPALNAPLGLAISNVNNTISNALTGILPNAAAGSAAWDAGVYGDTVLPRIINGVSSVLTLPIAVVAGAIGWVGNLPVLLYRTVADAIANPSAIPGLLSNLVFQTIGFTSPPGSLLYRVLDPILQSLITFPPPFGTIFNPAQIPGWVQNTFFTAAQGWNNFLKGLLPTPINPPPAAAVRVSAAASLVAPKSVAAQSSSPSAASGVRIRAVRPAAAAAAESAAGPQSESVSAAPDQPATATSADAAQHTSKHRVTRAHAAD